MGSAQIWFNGKKRNKQTGAPEESCKPQWDKYLAKDFMLLPMMPLRFNNNYLPILKCINATRGSPSLHAALSPIMLFAS
ncbi:MAG: hypothetical protein HHJ16_11085 [Polaromonas sp.]|nr:hypothetical protein [Polaromonas sp.]